jgi:hypothetical protein
MAFTSEKARQRLGRSYLAARRIGFRESTFILAFGNDYYRYCNLGSRQFNVNINQPFGSSERAIDMGYRKTFWRLLESESKYRSPRRIGNFSRSF